jgi:hypothetical protein
VSDSFLHRARRAASILVRGEPTPLARSPIPALTEAEVAEAKVFFPMPKFFIMGHARSGTTLLARLIRVHPEVHCNWQAHFFTRAPRLTSLVESPAVEQWLRHPSNRWNRGSDLSPVVMRAAADFILERDARRAGKSVVGDKSPNSRAHGEAVRAMQAVYPDAAVIYIVRDGRDVLVSQRFRNLVEEKNLGPEDRQIREALRADQSRFRDGSQSIFTPEFVRDYARSWVDDLVEVPAEGLRLYGNRFVSLRYEDLLARTFDEMRRLWAFLGVAVDPDLAGALEAEARANPDEAWQEERDSALAAFLPKGQAGNWRHLFTDRDRKLFKETAGDMLLKWGYEKDLDW